MPDGTCAHDSYRPQFHFTARENWLNDPNGCVYFDGEYHLFFQHNPFGVEHGHMTWGHAVSPDLVHWRQLPHAIRPYDEGTIYSGSAVVDTGNTSGLGKGPQAPLVAAFTHASKPFGQAFAFSNDRGRTWELFDQGKHIVPNQGLDPEERDPKIFRHDPSGKWVMVLWVRQGQVRFFTSDDLLRWKHVSDFHAERFYECPDLIELPTDGDPSNTRWVLYDAAFEYWVGTFDGETFTAEEGPLPGDGGANFYAAQTWNNTPGRVVQIAWMRGGKYPGMPFNQQMSFPCELSLKTTPRGIRVYRMPVKEITTLHRHREAVENRTLRANELLAVGHPGDLFDVDVALSVSADSSFEIHLCGQVVSYGQQRIRCLGKGAGLLPRDGMLRLRILVDRTSIELFGNDGELSMTSCFLPPDEAQSVQLRAGPTGLDIRSLSLHTMASSWAHDSQ